jgi:hypothetical protein
VPETKTDWSTGCQFELRVDSLSNELGAKQPPVGGKDFNTKVKESYIAGSRNLAMAIEDRTLMFLVEC